MRAFPVILGATLTAALISTPLMAAEPTGTLEKIKTSGPSPWATETRPFPSLTLPTDPVSRWATPMTFN